MSYQVFYSYSFFLFIVVVTQTINTKKTATKKTAALIDSHLIGPAQTTQALYDIYIQREVTQTIH